MNFVLNLQSIDWTRMGLETILLVSAIAVIGTGAWIWQLTSD